MGSLPDLHALAAMDRPVVGRMQPWDDCMLELAACPSPASSRMTACRLQPHRDSLCSSGGASSVRRLITTVRSAPPTLGPSYPRRLLLRNHATLCLGQLACKASLSPLLPLFPWWPLPEAGVLLLVALCSTAALSSLVAPAVLRYLGAARTLLLCHLVGCAFLAAHFAPVPASLVPAYLVMGTSLGPLAVARVTQLTSISCRLSAFDGAPELAGLTRGLQLAQDGGLLLGNAIAASLLHWADHSHTSADAESECGSSSCPEPESLASVDVGCRAGPLLAGALLGLTAAGTAITATCLDRFPQPLTPPPSAASLLKDSRLLLAMPITIFMGLEQGFMLADFSKWYVACVLSLTSISLAFVSLVVLQCVAAFTLSLVLPHIQRYLAVGVGAAFHACLLLVLLLWQPSQDDAALFYVISAAWGVCNAVWETLTLTYILSVYADCWQTPYALSHSFYWLGLGLAFGVHASFCVWVKLYALSAALILGVASYAWLEYKIGAKAAEAL